MWWALLWLLIHVLYVSDTCHTWHISKHVNVSEVTNSQSVKGEPLMWMSYILLPPRPICHSPQPVTIYAQWLNVYMARCWSIWWVIRNFHFDRIFTVYNLHCQATNSGLSVSTATYNASAVRLFVKMFYVYSTAWLYKWLDTFSSKSS